MKSTGLFAVLIIGTLLSSSKTLVAADDQDSPSACQCKPVITVNVDGNGRSNVCNQTGELQQEIKALKSDIIAVKKQLDQVLPGQSASQYDLYFTKRGINDYVIHHGLAVTNAFTSCFRIRTTDKTGNDRTVVSYSTTRFTNELTINRWSRIQFWLIDGVRETKLSANDGHWHFICVTWENRFGSWKVYKDGALGASGTGFQRGRALKSDGILIIGQEQDLYGGGFDPDQNYIGELTDLNIWDRVLPAAEILKLSKSCHGGRGNVKKWSDFKVGIRGDVRVISPSACDV